MIPLSQFNCHVFFFQNKVQVVTSLISFSTLTFFFSKKEKKNLLKIMPLLILIKGIFSKTNTFLSF